LEKEGLSCNEESYVKTKNYIRFITDKEYKNGNNSKQDDYKNGIYEYMILSKDEKEGCEATLLRNLSVEQKYLNLRWPSTHDLTQKLFEIIENHCAVYLIFDR
jgi:hypothetical protein